jgi:uncharacterized protein YgbK (DUF1537 family)
MTGPTVAVVADDLIWAERLRGLATASGAVVTMCRSARDLEDALTDVDAVIVDLSTRSFDPQVAIGRASQASRPVLAVGPPDADAVRARARALAYRALAEAGPDAIERWLERVGVRGSGQAAASGADRVPAEEPVGG